MSAIETRNIKFINKTVYGEVYKSTEGTDGDMDFIKFFEDSDTINETIAKIDQALNGHFDLIEDTDISNGIDAAFIRANGIEYWDEKLENAFSPLCPLQDFKELLIGWRDFLQTPPFHGQKIRKPTWWRRWIFKRMLF